MTTWTLTLPYPRPPKGLAANDRAYHMTKARSTAEVRQLVTVLVRAQRIPKMQRMGVALTWVVADRRRRDEDGTFPLYKAVVDGLASDKGVSAQLVPDDDPAHVHREHPRIEYRPGESPHFEVVIVDLSHHFRPDTIAAVITERALT